MDVIRPLPPPSPDPQPHTLNPDFPPPRHGRGLSLSLSLSLPHALTLTLTSQTQVDDMLVEMNDMYVHSVKSSIAEPPYLQPHTLSPSPKCRLMTC